MPATVYKYRIWCVTEGDYVYAWGEDEPTVCPNNCDHTIDATKTTIERSISEEVVEIKEENTPTGGHYRCLGAAFDAANNATTTYDFSIPYPISLLSATVPTMDLQSGDVAHLDVAPETVIGVITSNVAAEATEINVSSTVMENIDIGRCLILDDGVNDERHAVVAMNAVGSSVTIDTGTTNSYNVASPTYCKMSVCMAHNIEISSGTRLELGESKIGGSYIPANTTIRTTYINNGDEDVRFRIYIEFLY